MCMQRAKFPAAIRDVFGILFFFFFCLGLVVFAITTHRVVRVSFFPSCAIMISLMIKKTKNADDK